MTIASQSDLVAAVSNWLFGRTDLAARVPDFITLFEAKANRLLRCRQMETRAVATLNINANEPEFLPLPTDYQMMRRVRLINTYNTTGSTAVKKPRLRFATNAQMDDLRAEEPNPGAPIWFTVFGSELEFLPTPDEPYQVEMIYRALIPPLSANTTNWLLKFAPDTYLYGVLMEAAPYLHEDERIAVWSQGLSTAIQQLNDLSEEATYNAGPLTQRRMNRRPYS